MQQLQRGLTLVELMIATATIGILAALAVPSYQAYVYRAKATEVIVVIDKVHTVLAGLQAETGATVGRPIRMDANPASSGPDAEFAAVFCITAPGADPCRDYKPLPGLSKAETSFAHLGIKLFVRAGNDINSRKAGQYKVAVMENNALTRNNPALRRTAQQTILAVHHIMQPYTYRHGAEIGAGLSNTYLYMTMNGTRP